jgi:tetratricopeptide (TPR) repeat protein
MSAKKRNASASRTLSHKKPKQQDQPDAAGSTGMWWLLLGLLLATLAAYYPAWHGGMLWDDDSHITREELRSPEGLRRIWFELGATQQYYPVVHSAFWFLHKLWGEDTLGYHLANIILHAISAFLLALILRRLAVPGACLAAVIFALHPVHVESVAWVSELKNTLSGALYLGAALAYLHFDKDRRKRLYALALGLFVLALMSKTVTATLPAALLVVFWWLRGRLNWRRDALPLAPLFLFGAAAGLLTAWVEHNLIGAQGTEFQFAWFERLLIAGRAVWFYLSKLFWPANLIFVYPRWQIGQSVRWESLYPLAAAALLAGLWLLRKRSRAPLAAALIFGGTLFPALGFFNVFPFRFSFVADHFQYLASVAIIALFSAGLARVVGRWNLHPGGEAVATLFLGSALALLTWSQSRQYADAETLYRTTLSRNPSCWMAHVNLGKWKLDSDVEGAMAHFREALKLKPDLVEARHDLGNALQRLGRLEEAVTQYKEALQLRPDFAQAHNNLGNALQKLGRPEEALAECREAIRIDPGYPEPHFNLGVTLQAMGRLDEAVAYFQEALRLRPDYAEAHNDIGNVLQSLDRLDEALIHIREALRLRPDFAVARYNLGNTLQRMGRAEEAAAEYQEALRLMPDFAFAHNNLGSVLQGMGRLEEAAAHYREALRHKPDYPEAAANLTRVLAILKAGKKPDGSSYP